MPSGFAIELLRDGRSAALWWSSALFSVLVLAGHTRLDERYFAGVLIVAALANAAVAATRRPPLSRTLLLSQSAIAMATVAAVVLYLVHFVGPESLEPGVAVLLELLRFSVTDARAYLHILVYAVAFVALLTVALLAVSAWLGRRLNRPRIVATLYAASAVNLACDYAVSRPLFQVSGEPDALGFFFAAGIFGLESSLPLHLLLLAVCVVAYRRLRRNAGGS